MPRRRRERDLFFDAKWSGNGTVVVYEVAKPGYHPVRPTRVNVEAALEKLLYGVIEVASQPCDSVEPSGLPPSEDGNWFDRLFN